MGNLDELMASLNKKFKEDIVSVGLKSYDYERIPFTSPRLNYMTFGGIPIGKLTEFYGEEHGGKTTTALDIVANYQKMQGLQDGHKKVLYVDCENTLDVVWATKLGVDVDDLIIISPTTQGAETIFEMILDFLKTGEIGLVIIDSLGVMVSCQAMDKTVEEKTYGGIAMALTNFSKKAEGLCQKYKSTIIGINQMRADLNSQFGGKTTTGGLAWRHNCSVRLEFRQGKFIDDKGNDLPRGCENPSGNLIMVSMTKNKTCPPTRKTGFYTINYLTGIDYLKDLTDVAIKYGIIQQSGSWFALTDSSTGEVIEKVQGLPKVYDYLGSEEHMDVLMSIESFIDDKIADGLMQEL